MSKGAIKLQITDITSDQEWATDPTMIEVGISAAMLKLAEDSVAFMKDHDIDCMVSWSALPVTLYALIDDMHEDDVKGKQPITGEDGQEYVEFKPEYQLDGCSAKIFKDGAIQGVIPFKHSNEEVWFDIARIADLKEMFNAAPAHEPATVEALPTPATVINVDCHPFTL